MRTGQALGVGVAAECVSVGNGDRGGGRRMELLAVAVEAEECADDEEKEVVAAERNALAGSTPAAEANRRARAASLCGGNGGGGRRRRRLIAVVPLEIEQKVYGLKGISLAFGREEDEVPEKKPRVLAQSNAANLNNKGGYSASPSSADPNRMSERRVRRGSDPIHNRY
uniref:Uncharacterized protein n=2 Tax=Oryza TaxID=4527 RepID=A0A0E0QJH3_ORYRU